MSEKVMLVPFGDTICAIPVNVCSKYELSGDDLEKAKKALDEAEGDVTGQEFYFRRNSRGEAYERDSLDGNWYRSPAYD